jgi:hypothetical protein
MIDGLTILASIVSTINAETRKMELAEGDLLHNCDAVAIGFLILQESSLPNRNSC